MREYAELPGEIRQGMTVAQSSLATIVVVHVLAFILGCLLCLAVMSRAN